MTVTRRGALRFVAPVLAVAAAFGIGGQASAAPPQTLTRNEVNHRAFPFYDCGDFIVQAEWDVRITMTLYFAADGTETGLKGHVSYVGTMSNPTNGRWVDDRGVHSWTDDFVNGQTQDAGGYRKITAPGEGILIHDTGVIAWTWNDPFDPFDDEFLKLGGPKDELVNEGVIQEVDIATGKVLFEWRAREHVGIDESYAPLPQGDSAHLPYDYFHANSVVRDGPDRLIVSARFTNAVYRIGRATGMIDWRLGGEKSDFRMGRGTRFCRQHDARWAGGGTMTLFDNHVDRARDGGESRGLRLSVNQRRKRVRLLRGYHHPRHLAVANKGSARQLSNGNLLVGWGAIPRITEYTRRGRIVFDARFAGAHDGSYRAIRADWVGMPVTRPAVAVDRRGSRLDVWASWNGATEVARWQVLAGSPSRLRGVSSKARDGFETELAAKTRASHVAVRALDADGRVLGTSWAIRPRR